MQSPLVNTEPTPPVSSKVTTYEVQPPIQTHNSFAQADGNCVYQTSKSTKPYQDLLTDAIMAGGETMGG